MWILLLEAGIAFFLLVFIVWWTMFHGRSEDSSSPDGVDQQQPPEK